MNYETAKRLKDAGFPQKGNGYLQGDGVHDIFNLETNVYIPLLEEIIAECGETDGWIQLTEISKSSWEARCSHGITRPPDLAFGPTPLIAAANLYCALHPIGK